MYCQCSKGNNYNVVGIGNPEDFNQVADQSWIEITVPEVVTLPDCYPDIESIERVYVNVVVESTRVVKTPIPTGSNTENLEGLMLTGNKLVVDASICQTIVYTADVCEQTLHSINIKYPFCACIILPADTANDVVSDKTFCVDVLVENVYAKALSPKTICKCVTLFLAAKESQSICPA